MIEIIPTVIPKDLHALEERVIEYTAFSHTVHLDVNDGIFTEHISWPFGVGQIQELQVLSEHHGRLPKSDRVNYDIHLMAHDPHQLGLHFVRIGAQRLIAHAEAFEDAESTRAALDAWREAGAKEVGLAVLMHTPFEVIEPVLSSCQFIQFMSIAIIGAHGAKFDERVLPRIREFHAKYPSLVVAADGGINERNIQDLRRAGVSRFYVGSAILSDFNSASAHAKLLERASEVQ